MSVFILKILGILIIFAILAFAGKLWVNASRLEKEIEAEARSLAEELNSQITLAREGMRLHL